eukprot:TRINITY_DN14118_c0_g1_i1.p1 TRINITY_DN14118_c0_g1~~TRINITY_DN14118_c0_g1_i1.p1  ORF type:complete len:205 (+),score=57.80 TRINITY_DN14118_c0_g1_i1:104-718(+)
MLRSLVGSEMCIRDSLKPMGYSENEANWIGCSWQFGCVAGLVVAGVMADMPWVQRDLRRFVRIMYTGASGCFVLFGVVVSAGLAGDILVLLCIIGGSVFLVGTEGVFYELTVEEAFGQLQGKACETAVGSLMVLAFNVPMVIFLVLSAVHVPAQLLTWLLAAACTASLCLLLCCYRGAHNRRQLEAAAESKPGTGMEPEPLLTP